jgi:hypothetical protein
MVEQLSRLLQKQHDSLASTYAELAPAPTPPADPPGAARRGDLRPPGTVREIYRSAHYVIGVDDERRLVRRQRTGAGYASVAEVDAAYATMLEAAAPWHEPRYTLLSDLRLAPPRNDPAFEQVVTRYYDRLYSGFRKVAALVQTEAGRLHMTRLMTPEIAPRMRVFTSEPAALEFLLSPPVKPTPPGRRPR